ncbi:hypothetical protein ACI68E_004185 [Malassezia pachydermatis]
MASHASAPQTRTEDTPLPGAPHARIPTKSTTVDTWLMAPLTGALALYHILQFVPQAWLPSGILTTWGLPLDLFRMLGVSTIVPTRVLRIAMEPNGQLGRLPILHQWRESFGDEAIENLLWRLSNVEGRKLYLTLGAMPFLACGFCTREFDYQLFALYTVARIYLAQAIILALLTMSPHDTLPRLMNKLGGTSTTGALIPMRTRAYMRVPAMAILCAAFTLEAGVIFYASQMPVHGIWEHWHTNLHVLRHGLLLLLTVWVWVRARWQMPSIGVWHALQTLSATATVLDVNASRAAAP